jgi:hypothetical protein
VKKWNFDLGTHDDTQVPVEVTVERVMAFKIQTEASAIAHLGFQVTTIRRLVGASVASSLRNGFIMEFVLRPRTVEGVRRANS